MMNSQSFKIILQIRLSNLAGTSNHEEDFLISRKHVAREKWILFERMPTIQMEFILSFIFFNQIYFYVQWLGEGDVRAREAQRTNLLARRDMSGVE